MMRIGSLAVAVAFVLGGSSLALGGEKITPEQAKQTWTAMEKAHLTLAMAITAAERDSKGQAIGATGMVEKDQLTVEVPVFVGEKLMTAHVNNTGEVAETKPADKHPDAAKAKDIVKAFKDAKLTWTTVLENAEKHSTGKAVCAQAMLKDNNIEIKVTCLTGDKLTYCMVDKAGKVTTEEPGHMDKHGPKKP